MSWAKLDDGIYSHPKILRATPPAVALYVLSIAYAARHETDGELPEEAVAMLSRGVTTLASELVTLGLYDCSSGGYKIRSFLNYNPSAREQRKQRKEQKERVRRYRERNALHTRNADALPRVGTGRDTLSVSSPSSKKKRRARAEGIPLPDDFALTAEMAAKLVAKGCRGPALAFEQFRNHHLAKGTLSASWPHSFGTWVGNHGVYSCDGCGPKVRAIAGKPTARDNARSIAAEWAAEGAV